VKDLLKRFGLLFAVLLGFTAFSIDLYAPAMLSANAAPDHNAQLVSIQEPILGWKLLDFIKQDKVCSVSPTGVAAIKQQYNTISKTVNIAGKDVTVVTVHGNPLNKHLLEQASGEQFPVHCHVVHGNKVVAFLTPTIVS
jgi:hypothetical protein